MKFAVLAGDGIGPEVMREALKVLKAALKGVKLEPTEALVGGAAYDEYGTPLPKETLKICEDNPAILFGSVGGPKWEKLPPEKQPERGALLPLRKHFGLYANIRPVRVRKELIDSCPLKNELVANGVDVVIIRELTGGVYFSKPKVINKSSALDTMKYTREEISRIVKVAFETARARKKAVTSVDKANVLYTSLLWRDVIKYWHKKEYSDITLNHMYVDNAAMQLVKNPGQFDVIVTENMFGDILSDEAAMLAGSLGMLPSASINQKKKFGLYEPSGGSAPDIAGQGIANPLAQILSAALMLRYSFDMEREAKRIEKAVDKTIAQGYRTGDIHSFKEGEKLVNTKEMGDKVAGNL